jgi:hypothetical protein
MIRDHDCPNRFARDRNLTVSQLFKVSAKSPVLSSRLTCAFIAGAYSLGHVRGRGGRALPKRSRKYVVRKICLRR